MNRLLYLILCFTLPMHSADFLVEAQQLSRDLKSSLVKNLTEKISSEGPVSAVSYCHTNVKPIAKTAAGDRMKVYEFGRTSHKVRNEGNIPASFMESYLNEFAGKTQKEISKEYILHTLENQKKVYLEPLYIQPTCLVCHGESISKDVSQKINELYPKDKAVGFKLGEFRGFVWVKEK